MEDFTDREKLIYFAGLIDGEGHIGCQQYNNKPRPVIQLQMTDEYIVRQFANYFNMTFRELNSPSHQEGYAKGYKQLYHTRCECTKAYHVIKALYPFLQVKAADAHSALAYYDDRRCISCDSTIPPERNTNAKTCSKECHLYTKTVAFRKGIKKEKAS